MFVIDVANEDAKKNLELLYECFDKYAKDYFTVEWDKTTGDDGVETDDAEHKSFTCKIDGKDFLTFLQIQDTGAKNIIKFVGKTNETFFLTPYNSLGYMKYGRVLFCTSGFFIYFFDKSNNVYKSPFFSICKDDENNTTIIYSKKGLWDSPDGDNTSSFTTGFSVFNNKATAIHSMYKFPSVTNDFQSHIFSTSLTEMSVCDDHTHTKDTYVLVTAQNRQPSEFTLNGKQAVSNGYWCLLDDGLQKSDLEKVSEPEEE